MSGESEHAGSGHSTLPNDFLPDGQHNIMSQMRKGFWGGDGGAKGQKIKEK